MGFDSKKGGGYEPPALPKHDGSRLSADATPLDVMLMAMREAYAFAGPMAAAPYAEKCAPYMHARIAQTELKGKDSDKPLTVEFRWAKDKE